MIESKFSDGFFCISGINRADGEMVSVRIYGERSNCIEQVSAQVQDGEVKVKELRNCFVKSVFLDGFGSEGLLNDKYFLGDLEMFDGELVGRFGRVRKRIPDRDTCGYVALQYLRHKKLSLYQRASYLTVLYYAFLATGSEFLLLDMEDLLFATIDECEELVRNGGMHPSLYRDPRQMYLALNSVAWQYFVARGDVATVRRILIGTAKVINEFDFSKLALSLNASYILFWRAVFESAGEPDVELFWECLLYFQKVADGIKVSRDMTPGSLNDFARCADLTFRAKAIMDGMHAYNDYRDWIVRFNRVSQGLDGEQTRSFTSRFEKMISGLRGR